MITAIGSPSVPASSAWNGTPALTRPKKNSATCAGYLHHTSNWLSASRAVRVGVDEEAGIARGVRQERHDRHERERRMEAGPVEREPRQRCRRRADTARNCCTPRLRSAKAIAERDRHHQRADAEVKIGERLRPRRAPGSPSTSDAIASSSRNGTAGCRGKMIRATK